MRRALELTLVLGGISCAAESPTTPDPVVPEGPCVVTGAAPDSLDALACLADFLALASEPLDTSIPGARSVKVVVDRQGGDRLYFQNSQRYAIHHAFAAAHLSGGELPLVPSLSEFNRTEYYTPDRRFLLGAVTYYEGPKAWALEIAPYDTASAEMIATLFAAVKAKTWFGPALALHPTSEGVAAVDVPVPVITTDELFAGIDYQPLNLATAVGTLRFLTATELERTYVSPREIVVMDHAPNDISVVSGIVTEEFQTALSHINVLSRNRGTPNMALRGARSSAALLALAGKTVRLEVGAFAWALTEVDAAAADEYWQAHRPTPVVLPSPDLSVTALVDVEEVVDESAGSLRDGLKAAVRAFGGKTAHYSILRKTEGLPVRKAFGIPAHWFVTFMEDNRIYAELDRLLADPEFAASPAVREKKLTALRALIKSSPLPAELEAALKTKLATDYPGLSMRFRSSTNSEDLDGFPCAGCYDSHTGDPADWPTVPDAIRKTWASMFAYRTFEERAYYGIDHRAVVMPLLVHHNFPDEEANGVAVTANPFDPSGLQPGFFINVQLGGDVEVVHPPAGTSSDQLVYLFEQPGRPVTYLSHSSLVGDGATVLSTTQLYELGTALAAIHERFSPAYGAASGNRGWYAMDVEFKFDGAPGETPRLWVKQARPYPEAAGSSGAR